MLRENDRIVAWLLRFADAIVIALAFAAAFLLRFHPSGLVAQGWVKQHPGEWPLDDYVRALPFVVVAFLLALQAFGLYDPRRAHSPAREAGSAARASVVALVALLAVAEIARRSDSRALAAAFAVLATGGLALARAGLRAGLLALRRRGWDVRRAVVIGEGPLVRETVARLATPGAGVRVLGRLSISEDERDDSVPVLGSYKDVRAIASAHGVDQVLLAVPLERAPLLRELRTLLDALPVDVDLVPDTAGFIPIRPSVTDLDGLAIVTIRRAPTEGAGAFAKRALDLAGAGLGLIVLSPLLGAIALGIRLLDGAPILYRQTRIGWGGRPFTMLKFRTMVADAESTTGPVRTARGDPRRTRLGTFLRRTSLDELPQLWNVLRGDMSLVGPRPERPEFLDDLQKELPGYVLRLTVKAGMTGLAQVHGLRGDSSFAQRLEHDLEYVRRWSVWLDVRILALTFVRGFVHENAF